ncbi:MAG: GNAT family N-acetyltransferase [Akkermansiaceae bacterium]|nr:GNAT family N-acetyltransferase [Akkermansiaceae bacterium]
MTAASLGFCRLRRSGDPAWAVCMALYEDAFPSEERRDFADLMRLLEERECMHALSLEVSGRFVGFSVYWDFRDFLFLEHLAIVPRWRGQGIGGYFLDELARIRPVFHLLEAEPPGSSPMAARRIGGYRRHGFEIVSRNYLQPSYRPGEAPLPLWLMGRGEPGVLAERVALLRRFVYGVDCAVGA